MRSSLALRLLFYLQDEALDASNPYLVAVPWEELQRLQGEEEEAKAIASGAAAASSSASASAGQGLHKANWNME